MVIPPLPGVSTQRHSHACVGILGVDDDVVLSHLFNVDGNVLEAVTGSTSGEGGVNPPGRASSRDQISRGRFINLSSQPNECCDEF